MTYKWNTSEYTTILNDIEHAVTFDDVQLLPRMSNIESRSQVNTACQFTRNFYIDKPIVAAPMDSVCDARMAAALWAHGCVGVIHRFCSIEEQVKMVELVVHAIKSTTVPHGYRTRQPVICAAIGANGDSIDRAHRLVRAGVNVLVIDVAHGHHINVHRTIDAVRAVVGKKVDIVAGNIATKQAAHDLQSWGADALRVGIGGGSVCETRVRTGVGVPQLTAVDDISYVSDIPVISDGGIRYPGDVVKALAAGANTVMVGSLLAGTDEAPGDVFVGGQWPHNKNFKMFRGSARATIKMEKNGHTNHVEGAAKMVEHKGSALRVIDDIMDGVTSAMSYLGVSDIERISDVAEFVEISSAGLREAHPHLL
jgi:IMP dehydrogenase